PTRAAPPSMRTHYFSMGTLAFVGFALAQGCVSSAEEDVSSTSEAALRRHCGNGRCDYGETCSSCARDCGTCPPPTCTPTTCAAAGKNCGSISDGCGGTLNCGSCTAPETCGGGGVANVCGSSPPPPSSCTTKATWRPLGSPPLSDSEA